MRHFYRNGEEIAEESLEHSADTAPVVGIISAMLGYAPSGPACPHCGTTREMIEATGLVGCPLCYAVHEAYLVERENGASEA